MPLLMNVNEFVNYKTINYKIRPKKWQQKITYYDNLLFLYFCCVLIMLVIMLAENTYKYIVVLNKFNGIHALKDFSSYPPFYGCYIYWKYSGFLRKLLDYCIHSFNKSSTKLSSHNRQHFFFCRLFVFITLDISINF